MVNWEYHKDIYIYNVHDTSWGRKRKLYTIGFWEGKKIWTLEVWGKEKNEIC